MIKNYDRLTTSKKYDLIIIRSYFFVIFCVFHIKHIFYTYISLTVKLSLIINSVDFMVD